jgi:Mce-associated membrane protein
VENQQPDPDDLTGHPSDADLAASEPTAHEDEAVEDAETRTARRWFGGWPTAAVWAAATFVVGAAAFAGAALQPYLVDRADSANRDEIERTATAMVTALWTYTPSTVDTLSDRAADYLSGDFDAQYRKFVQAVVAANKEAQVSNSTEVVGVAVESVKGSDAVAIVFTNTTATSPLTQNIPSLKYVSYRLAMKHQGPKWRVTDMSTISFMDLTPRL